MINFESFSLSNGLKVIVHEDNTSPMAVVNIVYDVGSRDEEEELTGFAHLFEHLMFGGSVNIPNYDAPLQLVGGENNAFTSPDITNYYIMLPAENLETAFWLESDRMLSLSFDPQVLEVQRSVVIEEFKQRYLNQPYGEIWLNLRPLAYKEHSYRWATIGREISHIESATMEQVRAFFNKFYRPNNAVMVVGGNVKIEEVKQLAQKWFEEIPAGEVPERTTPEEPGQMEQRRLEMDGDVPANAIYIAFHMVGRTHADFHATDLLSDILGRGKSSRLYQALVEERRLFNSLDASVTGSTDPGLLVVNGKLSDGVKMDDAEQAIWQVIDECIRLGVSESELQKVKNKAESTLVFSEIELLNRCMNLAYAELLGDANLVNREAELLQAVTVEQMNRLAKTVLLPTNSSVLRYNAIKS